MTFTELCKRVWFYITRWNPLRDKSHDLSWLSEYEPEPSLHPGAVLYRLSRNPNWLKFNEPLETIGDLMDPDYSR